MTKIPLYIGTNFSAIELKAEGNFAFTETPCVLLYNKAKKMYYEADNVVLGADGVCSVTFSVDITKTMIPGVYTLEVYKNSEKIDILLHDTNHSIIATEVAASLNQ